MNSLPPLLLKSTPTSGKGAPSRPSNKPWQGPPDPTITKPKPRRLQVAQEVKVFSEWQYNTNDSRSRDYIKKLRKTGDNYAGPYSTTNYIEVEIECELFLKLARVPPEWKEYEPNDWDGRHEYLEKKETRQIDQPYLTTRYCDATKTWKVDSHEGRHRVAYLALYEGYTHVTILIGMENGPRGFKDIVAENIDKPGYVFVQENEGRSEPKIRAKLVMNTRKGSGVDFTLSMEE